MRIKLVKIGNSTGIRLPKTVIQNCGFKSELELIVREKAVILTQPQKDRSAWRALFQESIQQKPIKEKGGEWEW